MRHEVRAVQFRDLGGEREAMVWLVKPLRIADAALAGADVRSVTALVVGDTSRAEFETFGLDVLGQALDFRIGVEAIKTARRRIGKALKAVELDDGMDLFESFEIAVDKRGRLISLPLESGE